jgi:type IV secretory pathway VirB3-like protein
MTNEFIGLEPTSTPQKTAGEKFESIGFTFCKAATIILITQRYALPVAAGLTAIFYVMAYVKGKHDTRCILRLPLLIAGFWGVVTAVSLYALLYPASWHHLLPWA